MHYNALPILLLVSGASKHLGVIIEGESLLNDGAAIVLFNVFKDELIPQQGRSGIIIFNVKNVFLHNDNYCMIIMIMIIIVYYYIL